MITGDLEGLIGHTVDPSKVDYAVVSGVQARLTGCTVCVMTSLRDTEKQAAAWSAHHWVLTYRTSC